MCEKIQECNILECTLNKKGVCSWSSIPYECPCWNSDPIEEDGFIVGWIERHKD